MDFENITDSPLEHILRDEDAEPTILPLSLINKITKNFTGEVLGSGGFAVVYKGLLGSGGTVAVKKLSDQHDLDEKTYIQEVASLMKVKHKNIVRFLGYCADTEGEVLDYEGKPILAELTRTRLLCFEFLPNGSLEQFISEVPGALDWTKRYKIIKGICEGLHYLHEKNIVHLDLKPANILLDDKMMPKISDFGLARCFDEKKSKLITSNLSGTLGYLAPEFFNNKEITKKLDMYSLGVVIAETLTGQKDRSQVQHAYSFWSEVFETKSLSNKDALLEQVRVCAEISMKCLDLDPAKRPDTQCIIKKLYETGDGLSQELLQIYPFALSFRFEQNKEICCPINLTNKTERNVYFCIIPSNPERYAGGKRLKGVVSPHSTQAVCVTMLKHQIQPSKRDLFRILISRREEGREVWEETLMAFIAERSTATPAIMKQETIYNDNVFGQVESMDVHLTEPWIVTGHSEGYVCIWKMKKAQMRNMYLSRKAPATSNIEKLFFKNKGSAKFTSVKFIPRTRCIVSGDSTGFIHVYTYIDNQLVEVTNFEAHTGPVTSLAVHPTRHCMLSSSETELTQWEWDDNEGWVCALRVPAGACQVAFNPNSAETFAAVLDIEEYNKNLAIFSDSNPDGIDFPSEYPGRNTCVAYGLSGHDMQYLVIGNNDGHTEILDEGSNKYFHALKVANSGSVVAVACHPTLPVLITATEDGIVYLWNCTSTTYRLTQVLSFGHGKVLGFGFIDHQGFKRLVVAFSETVETLELDWSTLAPQQ